MKRKIEQKNPFKSDEIYGYRTLYRETAYFISRHDDYKRAIQFFDEAIKKTPLDIRALIGRSRARAAEANYKRALEDVKTVLNLDPDDVSVLGDKALNLYLSGEFEESLTENCRLLPRRQKPDNFALGIMQCSDAIENCVGDRAGRPLRDHFEIIRRLSWQKNFTAQKPFKPTPSKKSKRKKGAFKSLLHDDFELEAVQPKVLTVKEKDISGTPELGITDSLHLKESERAPVPTLTEPFLFKPLQKYTSNIKNYMAEKYLDSMYLDKIFLEKLQFSSGLDCPNKKGSLKIKHIARNCNKKICHRQELMRSRRPFYFFKFQEAKLSGSLRKRQKLELEQQQKTTKREADNILARMIKAYKDKKLKLFLDLVEKLQYYCDSKPNKFIPDKSVYMKEIHDKACKAFYEVYRLNKTYGVFRQNKRLYTLLGFPLSREASSDSVIRELTNVVLNYKTEISKFKHRLENAVSSEEICWCYHELSRFHMETRKYDLARLYAKRGIHTAKLITNYHWVFNFIMLLVKLNVLQQNKNDAKNYLLEARQYTKILKDGDKATFINKCLEAMEQMDLEDVTGLKELERREKKIIQMMVSSHMKEEVAHLFKLMAAMPPSRRMTVMPGVVGMGSKSNSTSSPKQSSLRTGAKSILPTPKQSKQYFWPKVQRPSKETSADEQRGISFKSFL